LHPPFITNATTNFHIQPPHPASIFIMSIIVNALPIPPISEFGDPFYRSAEQAIPNADLLLVANSFAITILQHN
jgi:hypothetical protein